MTGFEREIADARKRLENLTASLSFRHHSDVGKEILRDKIAELRREICKAENWNKTCVTL